MRVLLHGFVWAVVGGLVGFVAGCVRFGNPLLPKGNWSIYLRYDEVGVMTGPFCIALGGVFGLISGFVRTGKGPPHASTRS
jgi:hypothetical protein